MARNISDSTVSEFNKIVFGTKIHGEIETQGDIRIDGTVVGTLDIKGKLVLGPKGLIEGEVKCNNAEVMGAINGEIAIQEILSLKASARIKGDIVTKKISIEPGAILTGTIDMDAPNNISNKKVGESNVKEKAAVK